MTPRKTVSIILRRSGAIQTTGSSELAENTETGKRGQTRKEEAPMLAELVTIEEELRDYMHGWRR